MNSRQRSIKRLHALQNRTEDRPVKEIEHMPCLLYPTGWLPADTSARGRSHGAPSADSLSLGVSLPAEECAAPSVAPPKHPVYMKTSVSQNRQGHIASHGMCSARCCFSQEVCMLQSHLEPKQARRRCQAVGKSCSALGSSSQAPCM